MSQGPRPTESSHPIVKVVLAALKVEGETSHGQGPQFSLGSDGKLRVHKALDACADQRDKRDALKELVCLAWFLEKKQASPQAATELLDVAEAVSGDLASLRESLAIDSDTLHEAAKRYHQLLGNTEGPRAPKLGDKGAEGSIKAGSLGRGLRRI